ncbi:MAG: tetratricopeptide repeat protein, partial [Candidatus Omnitrophica bacterium]|nr:tetratricopeptide repeat protein [Candidatus Omnitrophota bacterium]
YLGLGWIYNLQGKFAQAEEALNKALELNPKSDSAYLGLGWIYNLQGKFAQAEEALNKALELNPENDPVSLGLIGTYLSQNKILEAEELCKKQLEIDPFDDKLQAALATIYSTKANPGLMEEYFRKANELRGEYYLPSVIENYRKLKEILDQRGIRLVCAQYPMRSVEPLKKVFEATWGIIFIDNEKIFKEAVKNDGYKIYFLDMAGGDFGHCTPKGNRLLAENIAEVILEKVFGK